MTEKIKHFIGRVPYATHTTHRIPAPRFDQTSGSGNTDLNPTDDERRILTNVARHAQATKVWVYLGEEQGAVGLEVEDNGVGISPAQMEERHSLGLLGMRERAAAFGGAVEIAGAPGQGTTVIVRMPLLGENDEHSNR